MEELQVKDSNFRWNSIQCSWCGAVVGVVEFQYVGSLVHELAEKLRVKLD
jgi:hypothetical protein